MKEKSALQLEASEGSPEVTAVKLHHRRRSVPPSPACLIRCHTRAAAQEAGGHLHPALRSERASSPFMLKLRRERKERKLLVYSVEKAGHGQANRLQGKVHL